MSSKIIITDENYDDLSENHDIGFPCLNCEEHCCKEYEIFITHKDLFRIHTNIPEVDVLSYIGITDIYSGTYPRVLLENKEYQLILKKAPGTTGCVFLAQGVNMCAIHNFSPYICQMYPFRVPYDDYCSLELRENRRCKKSFLPPQEKVAPMIEQSKQFWTEEMDAFSLLVKMWNDKSPEQGLSSFISYLLSACFKTS